MRTESYVNVVGHKNPDTDSICSAIAYAWMKNQMGDGKIYEPRRAGDISTETAYVLDRFGMPGPELLEDVRTQVKDIELGALEIADSSTSVRRAWEKLSDHGKSTLISVDNAGRMNGLITIGDIAKSIMDVHGSDILAEAKTPYSNIIDTLEAEVLCGDVDACATGKVLIAAANPDLMEEYIEPGDMVIMGDRYESQLCALEMQAACLVICINSEVDENIIRIAREQGTVVLRTHYDTYIAARLMNQSIPIDYFMIKNDIMCFRPDDYIDDIRGTIVKVRHRAFPVLDQDDHVIGLLTRRSLLGMQRKQVILVDHNEENQAVSGMREADILEIIDHHKLGFMPMPHPVLVRNQPVGCTGTILYMISREKNLTLPPEIAGLMCSAIISDTLLYRSPTCTPADKMACEALAKIAGIDTEAHAKAMFTAASSFSTKTDKEILYQDFKRFNTGDYNYGVGQITAMDGDELESIVGRMHDYMQKEVAETGLDMMFFMLTDILKESSIVICAGEEAFDKLQESTGLPEKEKDCLYMEGFVSRKKQMIPALIRALS